MITFIVSIILLFLGYFIYGKFVERVFGADPKRPTPAYKLRDNVDYMPMNTFKAYMIEFLDIAGLGPVFGAILGAAYGPVAFLWIILGGIFGGAVHDYFSGMMSVRQNGESIAEVVGKWLGISAKQFMRFFTVFFMILVGAAFMMGPAKILTVMIGSVKIFGYELTGKTLLWSWVGIIFLYYFLATLLPIDKIIGRIYPIFGLALLFMALGIGGVLLIHGHAIPEVTISNLHNMKTNAEHYPIFPLLFITISCGALSGFHSTQAPLMARTIKNEKHGRFVFYGAMLTETFVALIWAAAAMVFFHGGVKGLNDFLTQQGGNPAKFVADISSAWLGKVGGLLAVLGVIAAPITTGDTALRSARLIVADFTKLKQDKMLNRLVITIPIFLIALALLFIKFDALWRLMFWFNQILATIVLWAITVYLAKKHKLYVITLIPAIFMTAVVVAYLFVAQETLAMSKTLGYTVALLTSLVITALFFYFHITKYSKQEIVED